MIKEEEKKPKNITDGEQEKYNYWALYFKHSFS